MQSCSMEKTRACRKRIFSIGHSATAIDVTQSNRESKRVWLVSSVPVQVYNNISSIEKSASASAMQINVRSPVRVHARTLSYLPSPTLCVSSPTSFGSGRHDSDCWLSESPQSECGDSLCAQYEYIEYVPHLPLETPNTVVTQTISSETLMDALDGKYNHLYDSIRIIDCRFPFEYNGGHICGAENLYTWEQISAALFPASSRCIQTHSTKRRELIVLHCEFSQQRGPSWWGRVRTHDRETRPPTETNLNQFIYPEMYVLKNGYKDFFEVASTLLTQHQHVSNRENEQEVQCKRQKTDRDASSHTPVRQKQLQNAGSPFFFANSKPSYIKMSSPEHTTECAQLMKQFQDETNPKRRTRKALLARALFAH
jgi:hypothetical protein